MSASIDLRRVTARGIRTFRQSAAFELTLLVDGRPVLLVSNDGQGGSHRYLPARGVEPKAAWDMKRRLETAAKAATGDAFEPLDSICAGLADGVKDGAAAADLWKASKVEYDRMFGVEKPSLAKLVADAKKKR